MRTHRTRLLGIAAALLLVTAACSDSVEDEGPVGAGGNDDPEARTTRGVTDDTISLGVLTDQSGPFIQLGTGTVDGHQIWADEVNAAGGICGRQIELVVRDHGYQADAGVLAYQELLPEVLGFMQILGSPVIAARAARQTSSSSASPSRSTCAASWSTESCDV